MIPVYLTWVAEQTNGTLVGDDLLINSVTTDSRQLEKGDLFLALSGANFDGHGFVSQAEAAGASAVIVSQPPTQLGIPYILVEDTHTALGQLAAAVKREVAPKTVAITGSSGKTTVKEMVAAILQRRGSVLSTAGNFNNDIGVPLTLLRLEKHHEFAVMELGANHLGEIAYTVNLVQPDVATIINAAASHLEGFGSLFGVARAKSEIFKCLSAEGIAVLNADSQFLQYWQGKLKRDTVLTFSQDADQGADFYATDVSLGLDGCAAFVLNTPQGTVSVNLNIPGVHNIANALAAAALAVNVGASLEDVREGLASMQQVKGRLNVKQISTQVRILDDTYNANVASVKAGIDLLSTFSGLRVLVLGDMAELGEKARHYHQIVGEHALEKGIDRVLTLGVLSQHASSAMGSAGAHFSEIEKLIESLSEALVFEQRDITILVKGSRSSKMERVVTAIEESPVGKFERRRERIAC
ncbi:UDP-N-acetylmuramoyl-tripeptide--D-alanyl-D-alanine ligase [Alteromonas oceanisediminis]|uniref:UDP-N-acetylmuramoyl-tripeptide--D-alanyl-D- alanine ligase n=1 Tax=Alteromonas oceanisediminis TaxID=2836180 RepID=UPI001BDB4057|nr:UDP-N-acetylmuramoyl-tripeptide--D-alanyl-D-alanine ligase [Alteromonas oceanisediminis]MBT0585521.1 UDP-N-acetylmuramoyl-tripeptide--D-alanyl-D-alanine ligase [Alteromonas oceanisediminis]